MKAEQTDKPKSISKEYCNHDENGEKKEPIQVIYEYLTDLQYWVMQRILNKS